MSNLVTLTMTQEEAEDVADLLREDLARVESRLATLKRDGVKAIHPKIQHHQRILSMLIDRLEFNMSSESKIK